MNLEQQKKMTDELAEAVAAEIGRDGFAYLQNDERRRIVKQYELLNELSGVLLLRIEWARR